MIAYNRIASLPRRSRTPFARSDVARSIPLDLSNLFGFLPEVRAFSHLANPTWLPSIGLLSMVGHSRETAVLPRIADIVVRTFEGAVSLRVHLFDRK